jgi:dihydroorotase
LADLVTKKLRPGDIYTHCFSGLRDELIDGRVNPGMVEGRKRGVIFDVGHGSGSFAWRIAVPALKQGFPPDSISTDLHAHSMNNALQNMPTLMSKFLAMGMSLDDVFAKSTWAPAHEIGHEELGNLSVGAPADVSVFSLQHGSFGFDDMYGARMNSNSRLFCELTIRDGKVVYDLNAISRQAWTTLPSGYRQTGDARWDALHPQPPARSRAASETSH